MVPMKQFINYTPRSNCITVILGTVLHRVAELISFFVNSRGMLTIMACLDQYVLFKGPVYLQDL